MCAGELGRGDHAPVLGLSKPCDIFGHGSGEQLDILRQITDIFAKLDDVPLRVVGAIDANVAAFHGPYACQRLDLKLDLPAPEAPTTATVSPGWMEKLTPLRLAGFSPRGHTTMPSASRCPAGRGNDMLGRGWGSSKSRFRRE